MLPVRYLVFGALVLAGCLFGSTNCDGLFAKLFGAKSNDHLPENMRQLNEFLEGALPNSDDLKSNLNVADKKLRELSLASTEDLSVAEVDLMNSLNAFLRLKATISERVPNSICSIAALDSLDAMYARIRQPIDRLFDQQGDADVTPPSRIERTIYDLIRKHLLVCPPIYSQQFRVSSKRLPNNHLRLLNNGLARIIQRHLCSGDSIQLDDCHTEAREFVARHYQLITDYVYKSMPMPDTPEDLEILRSEAAKLELIAPDHKVKQNQNRLLNECNYFRDDYQSLLSGVAFDLRFVKSSELMPLNQGQDDLLEALIFLEVCQKVKRAASSM